MIEETGRVVALEADAVWVETIRESACGACSAQKGCGQSVLERWVTKQSNHVRAVGDVDGLQVNDEVVIGIPEDIVVKSSLLMYVMPLIMMIVFAVAADAVWAASAYADLAVAGFGLGGFALAMLLIRWHHRRISLDGRYQPVVMRRQGRIAVQMHDAQAF